MLAAGKGSWGDNRGPYERKPRQGTAATLLTVVPRRIFKAVRGSHVGDSDVRHDISLASGWGGGRRRRLHQEEQPRHGVKTPPERCIRVASFECGLHAKYTPSGWFCGRATPGALCRRLTSAPLPRARATGSAPFSTMLQNMMSKKLTISVMIEPARMHSVAALASLQQRQSAGGARGAPGRREHGKLAPRCPPSHKQPDKQARSAAVHWVTQRRCYCRWPCVLSWPQSSSTQ